MRPLAPSFSSFLTWSIIEMDSRSKSDPSDPYKLVIRYLDDVDDPTLEAHVRRSMLRNTLTAQGLRNGIIPASILSLLPMAKLNQLMTLLSDYSTEAVSFTVGKLKKYLELDDVAYDDSEEVRRKRARLGARETVVAGRFYWPPCFDRDEFAWLKRLPYYNEMQYRPMQLANRLFEKRLDRDDALEYCYSHFNHILSFWEKHIKSGEVYLHRTPMIAFAASPGSGKSFLIDELGELREADIEKFCGNKSRQNDFKTALVLKVSYCGDCSPLNPNDRGDIGFCARIIWGYFRSIIHPAIQKFQDFFCFFYDKFKDKSTTYDDCIQVTANHFLNVNLKQRAVPPTFSAEISQSARASMTASTVQTQRNLLILLLVDELSKSGFENSNEMSTYVGNLMDQGARSIDEYSNFFLLPVFTGTTTKLLYNPRMGDCRVMESVPLSVPLKSAPAEMKAKLKLGPNFDSLIDVLCNDVGYHGRMLETIVKLLEDNTCARQVENEDPISTVVNLRHIVLAHSSNPLLALPICQNELLNHAENSDFFSHLHRGDLMNAVCVSLLGRSVSRTQKIEASYLYDQDSLGRVIHYQPIVNPTTYDILQDLGVFIGDDATGSKFYYDMYPVMSPLQFLQWATLHRKSNKNQNGNELYDSIIQVFSAVSKEGVWQSFERFHHNVRVLHQLANRQLGLKNNDDMTPNHRFFKLVTERCVAHSAEQTARFNSKKVLKSTFVKTHEASFKTAAEAAALNAVVGSTLELAFKQHEQIFYDVQIYHKVPGIRCDYANDYLKRRSWSNVLQWLEKAENLTSQSETICEVYLAAAHESLFQERYSDKPEQHEVCKKHPNPAHVNLLNHALLVRWYGPSIKSTFALVVANARAQQVMAEQQ